MEFCTQAKFRELVVAMVLATDMTRHVGLVSAFKSKVEVQWLAGSRLWSTWKASIPYSKSESGMGRMLHTSPVSRSCGIIAPMMCV